METTKLEPSLSPIEFAVERNLIWDALRGRSLDERAEFVRAELAECRAGINAALDTGDDAAFVRWEFARLQADMHAGAVNSEIIEGRKASLRARGKKRPGAGLPQARETDQA